MGEGGPVAAHLLRQREEFGHSRGQHHYRRTSGPSSNGVVVFAALTTLVQPWANLYADHPTLAAVVLTLHVLSMFVGGGMAIAADRRVMLATPTTAETVRTVLGELSTTHTIVISSLAITLASGIAIFATDVTVFSVSTIYWTKMALLTLLLLNGDRLRRAERTAIRTIDATQVGPTDPAMPFPQRAWRDVRRSAVASVALWLSVVALGVVLANA